MTTKQNKRLYKIDKAVCWMENSANLIVVIIR
jgi:hypothetical protein